MGSASGLLVQVLIALGVVGPAFLGGMFARRKSAADVEVTLSTEARQWAVAFAEGAKVATESARVAMEQAAEARGQAVEARKQAAQAEVRAQVCESRVDLMEQHIAALETIMRQRGITPPTPPWAQS